MGSRSRRWLNQSTYSRVAYSTWSRSFHGARFVDEFCLVQTNDGLREGVVVRIPNRADRWFDAGFRQPVRVANGQILGGFNWWSQHLVMKEVHGECCGASGGDSCDARPDAVAWSAVESAA